MADLQLTEEQIHAVKMARSGETFVVDAVAGSGKTTTARRMCEAIDGRVLYLVYNTAAAADARKTFPSNVKVSTTSALAWAHFEAAYGDRILGPKDDRGQRPGAPRVPARETARLAGLTEPIRLGGGTAPIQPVTVARLATDTIDRFCYSADKIITVKHAPVMPVGLMPLQEEVLRDAVIQTARKIWHDSLTPKSKHRFTFDHAFKLLVMTEPNLGYDTVIIDEAQDSNAATMRLLNAQHDSQLIAIGDPAQQLYCQPLGTQVEVVTKLSAGSSAAESEQRNIEDLKVGDHVVTYDNTHLWRHGRPITHITRFPHDGEMVTLTTSSGASSTYTPKHHCIVRIDDNLADKYVVYLMRRGNQYRIGRTRMMYASQHKGFGIVLRCRREKADAVWILSAHDTLGEASLAEMLTQHAHNIPGVHFEPADNDAADIRLFWEKIGDNASAGESCLKSFGRLADFPLWYPELDQKMGIRTAIPTAAANVMDGMTVLPLRNVDRRKGKAPRQVWEPVTVARSLYTGDVVSLEVDEHHNYFGDGILTHNSWRGATDIMGEFEGPRLGLSKSFRFGEAIADEANKWLPHTGTHIRVTGNENMNSRVTILGVDKPDAILCRTNVTVMAYAMSYLEQGRRVAVCGGTSSLENLAHAAYDLRQGKPTAHPELAAFNDWADLLAYTNEPGGGDLRALVTLIDEHGIPEILKACKQLVPEGRGRPDVVISTAHKAKGREWSRVVVADDFREPQDIVDENTGHAEVAPIDPHSAMLHYVTVTRAREHLDRSGLAWIDRHPAPKGI